MYYAAKALELLKDGKDIDYVGVAGEQEIDENGEEIPIAPENLVIQFTKYSLTEEVDVNGARIPLAEVAEGSGAAWVLRNGQLLEARWNKPNITVHPQFVDGTGKSISMAPGSTWILLAPRDSARIVQEQD